MINPFNVPRHLRAQFSKSAAFSRLAYNRYAQQSRMLKWMQAIND